MAQNPYAPPEADVSRSEPAHWLNQKHATVRQQKIAARLLILNAFLHVPVALVGAYNLWYFGGYGYWFTPLGFFFGGILTLSTTAVATSLLASRAVRVHGTVHRRLTWIAAVSGSLLLMPITTLTSLYILVKLVLVPREPLPQRTQQLRDESVSVADIQTLNSADLDRLSRLA